MQIFLTQPASKSDQGAHGISRGHRCRCDGLASRFSCPTCCVRDQLSFLKRQFPAAWTDDTPSWSLPLFPGIDGAACTKEGFVATIVEGARRLELPLMNPDSSRRVSGHSLRVGGAQGMTRLGFPLWSIQLLGRWGSDAVKGYVGDVALEAFTEATRDDRRAPVDLECLFTCPAPTDPTDADGLRPGRGRGSGRVVARGSPAARRAGASASSSISPFDAELLEKLVAERAGELRAELLDALLAELRLEIARATPARPTVTDTGTATCPSLVRNTRTKEVHIVAIGPDSGRPNAHWSSLCGWAFGHWGRVHDGGRPHFRDLLPSLHQVRPETFGSVAWLAVKVGVFMGLAHGPPA